MRETIRFPSVGEELEAFLYLPVGPGPHPCVVMAGGWCYVKELAQPTYAEAMAEAGMAALVFDYRTVGGSTGEPRQHLDPWAQIEDYRSAISHLETDPRVDADRIGAWGISYSGGHVLILGALDPRVRAVCAIVPVIDGYENLRLAHGTMSFRRLKAALIEARRSLYTTGEITYIDHQPATEADLGTWPFPPSRIVFADLKAKQAPAYEGYATAASTELLLGYSVQPFLVRLGGLNSMMVLAEGDDHTHWDLALKAHAAIPGTAKELHIVPRAGHLTLYQDDDVLRDVAHRVAEFFRRTLV
jgi:fermentation-respiration switch protein FrsA (DUF1100 family)